MRNTYRFRICSYHKIMILMEMIEMVYENEYIYEKEIMSSFFNIMNMKTKLLENEKKSKKTGLMFLLFNQQEDNIFFLCDLLIVTLEDTMKDLEDGFFKIIKKSRKITNEINELNVEIKFGNQLIFDMMELMKNYDNKMTRYPRCHHYENKIHTQLFTELGDILICKECVGLIEEAWCLYVKDYFLIEKITRMIKLRTPPF